MPGSQRRRAPVQEPEAPRSNQAPMEPERGNAAAQADLRRRATSHPYGGRGTPAEARQSGRDRFDVMADQADRDGRGQDYDALRAEANRVHPDPGSSGGTAGRRETASLTTDGSSLSAEAGNEEYDEDGAAANRQVFNGRVSRNQVRGGYNQTEGSGDSRRGGGGSVTVEHGRGRSGGALAGSLARGRQTYTARGGHTVVVDPPVEDPPGRFTVSGTVTDSLGGGASTNRGASFGLTGSRETTRTFSEVFTGDTAREEAYRFYNQPDSAVRQTSMPTSFAEAAALDEGEARGLASGWNGGGSVSGDALGVDLSAGVEVGHNQGVRMQRGEDQTLVMTLSYEDPTALNASAGAGGTSVGYTTGREIRRTSTWTLHLDQDGAEAAYNQLQAGNPLHGESGPGWERTSTRLVEINTSGATAQMFGIELDGAESEESSVQTDERGTIRSNTWRTDAPGVSQTAFRRNEYELNEGERRTEADDDFTVTNTVVRDNLDLSEEALADVSNGMDGNAMGSGEGTWTVESSYSEAQIDHFAAAAVESSRPPGSLPPRLHGEWATLQEALRANPHDSEAIGRFLQVSGADGTRALHSLSGGPQAQHVQLTTEGGTDANFPGRASNEATERQIADIEMRMMHIDLGGDTPDAHVDLGRQAESIRSQLRARRDAITVQGAYPDLPATLVNAEASRLEGWIRRLSRVVRRGVQAEHPQAANNADTGEPGGMGWTREEGNQEAAEGLAEVTGEDADAVAEESPMAICMRLLGDLSTAHDEMVRWRNDAHFLWDAHNTPQCATESPRDRFTGGMRWLTGGAMNEGYSTMQMQLNGADAQYGAAESRYQSANERLQPEAFSGPSDQLNELVQLVRNTQGFMRLTTNQYRHVHERLDVMRLRQRGMEPGVWP